MKNKMHSPYKSLIIMGGLHLLAMFFLMYSMVDNFSNILFNFNQFYMAAIMTAPMIILELFFMNKMYHNKKINLILIAVSVIILVIFFLFIRYQTGIADRQFLKSMIPHHAAAILMCEKTQIIDPEIQTLCNSIISSQQKEINQMKEILIRLK
ncbi:DUF305 domain-containing protein [Candidatus Pacearchaeota archaeon]|nr:DUF305 domain-containing protein [Candidatus Pacearchaeota archaeon]